MGLEGHIWGWGNAGSKSREAGWGRGQEQGRGLLGAMGVVTEGGVARKGAGGGGARGRCRGGGRGGAARAGERAALGPLSAWFSRAGLGEGPWRARSAARCSRTACAAAPAKTSGAGNVAGPPPPPPPASCPRSWASWCPRCSPCSASSSSYASVSVSWAPQSRALLGHPPSAASEPTPSSPGCGPFAPPGLGPSAALRSPLSS